MARMVSLGSALQDIYLIDHDDLVPTEIGHDAILGKVLIGTKVDIDKISYEVGGAGINSAITFARHGHEVVFIGNISHDPGGGLIVKTLDAEGIDSSYVNFINRKLTGTSIILLDTKSGERTILTYRGASQQFGNLSEKDLDLIQPDYMYTSTLRGDLETLERFFKKANQIGTKVMFNPGVKELDQKDKLMKLFKYVDTLIVNKHEASQLVPGTTLTELLYHLKDYAKTVIITDGAMGGIATNGEETYRFGLYESVQAKDTTGAGDAFGSGFLAHIADGHSFRESLVFASANSISVVMQFGANKGIINGNIKLHPMPIQKI
ncbi:carbohydrate kinase family protein [Candidatus Saccharibacteria bacterium]|nr:carbohydrate kinase family protein [Candidatus Saccharibacteria bacterium]